MAEREPKKKAERRPNIPLIKRSKRKEEGERRSGREC